MIYHMYLASLCSRRNWPEPQYEYQQTRRGGYIGIARVNNREYVSETEADSAQMAMSLAASQAYVICRNFSLNNGMYPDQKPNDAGLVQGLPAAIGSGRRGGRRIKGHPDHAFDSRSVTSDGSSNSETHSAASSPTSSPRCACGEASYGALDQCAHCYHYQHQQLRRRY